MFDFVVVAVGGVVGCCGVIYVDIIVVGDGDVGDDVVEDGVADNVVVLFMLLRVCRCCCCYVCCCR